MRALVTGGAGFIGSHVVDGLLARGDEVVVLDDLSTGSADNVNGDAELLVGDIADPATTRAAADRCEVVFHQAAHRAVARSVEHPMETDRANVGGTLSVLLAARDAGARRVVYASSSSVYGGAAVRPTPESAPLAPRSPYAVSKLAAEHYCRVFTELYSLETVALRYFNVFGPRQRPDSQYAAVIPLFTRAISERSAPEIHGDGLQSRHFAFVADVVRANLLAASAPSGDCSGRAYNIAGADAHTLLDLLTLLEDCLGMSAEPTFVGPRAGDVRQSLADLS
ncbi:MAG: NAD-dependent epimerase/dehydratase family protein, partial [Acidimicrobiia bacterium]